MKAYRNTFAADSVGLASETEEIAIQSPHTENNATPTRNAHRCLLTELSKWARARAGKHSQGCRRDNDKTRFDANSSDKNGPEAQGQARPSGQLCQLEARRNHVVGAPRGLEDDWHRKTTPAVRMPMPASTYVCSSPELSTVGNSIVAKRNVAQHDLNNCGGGSTLRRTYRRMLPCRIKDLLKTVDADGRDVINDFIASKVHDKAHHHVRYAVPGSTSSERVS